MKPFNIWDIADLQELIADQVQESLTLDYKASTALVKTEAYRAELSKDVSAFANSAGGRIVFGITEDNHLPAAIDAGVDPTVITREWIEQVINSNIQPRVQGITIKQIDVGQGRVTYALDIPQATSLAPHQARDHRYYKRYNFQSIAMEDYEVRDTLRRSTTPAPFLKFTPGIPSLHDEEVAVGLRVMIGNSSNEPALYTVVSLFVDDRLWTDVGLPGFAVSNTTIQADAVPYGAKRLVKNFGIPGSLPLFKEQIFDVGMLPLRIGVVPGYLGYKVASPGCSIERFGTVRFDGNAAVVEGLE